MPRSISVCRRKRRQAAGKHTVFPAAAISLGTGLAAASRAGASAGNARALDTLSSHEQWCGFIETVVILFRMYLQVYSLYIWYFKLAKLVSMLRKLMNMRVVLGPARCSRCVGTYAAKLALSMELCRCR
jgi:hypothetical protein